MKRRLTAAILTAVLLMSVLTTGVSAATGDDDSAVPAAQTESAAETVPAEASVPADTDEPAQTPDKDLKAVPDDTAAPALTAHSDAELAPTADAADPAITRVYPSVNGATILWSAYEGAAKYYVFSKNAEGRWKVIGSAAAESFEFKKLANNTEYTFTVRAANADGAFISGYDRAGYVYRYFSVPKLKTVSSVVGGQRLTWEPVEGAKGYNVYVRYPDGWKSVCLTDKTAYLNTNVTSGKQYHYTVRCWDSDRRTADSYFDRTGITGVYIAAPQISGFTPVSGGIGIRWDAVDGATRYCVFMKNSGKWKKIGATDKTAFNHTGLSNHTLYTYTVRCIDKNGEFCSGYNTAGSDCRYIAPPQITGVNDGQISWNADAHAAGYRVYRKEFTKSWVCLGKTYGTVFNDASAAKNTLYTYTVRCLDTDGKLSSYFTDTGKYYINGALADGTYTVGGNTYRFVKGEVLRQGYVTIDGKMYYYNAQGVLQKNGLVGSSKEGYRYADKNGVVNLKYTGLASNSAGTWYLKNGVLDRTLRDGVTIGGTDYMIINGKATKVTTDKQYTLFLALKIVARVTDSSMSKSQKLKAVWNHLTTAYDENNPRADYFGMDWPEVYANDIFEDGTGSCFSYAAAFAYLAKAVGYSRCYACNSGGHGWAEVDGLVYDPEWSMHSSNYSYYAMSYDEPCDVPYKAALSIGSSWSHVAVG